MDGLLGVAGIIIDSDYGSFPKLPCELSTSKMMQGWNKQNRDFHSTDMGIVSCNAQCSKPVQADDYLRLYYWLAASTRLGTIVVIVKLDTSILISQCNFFYVGIISRRIAIKKYAQHIPVTSQRCPGIPATPIPQTWRALPKFEWSHICRKSMEIPC